MQQVVVLSGANTENNEKIATRIARTFGILPFEIHRVNPKVLSDVIRMPMLPSKVKWLLVEYGLNHTAINEITSNLLGDSHYFNMIFLTHEPWPLITPRENVLIINCNKSRITNEAAH